MPMRPFAHLHCHSHYSLLDGASRIPELVERTKSQGMTALALTDHGNLYGAIEFYRECRSAGINPIVGYEAYVSPGKRNEREARRRGDAGYHLTLLAKNLRGFKSLVKLASIAFLEGYHYVPRIDKEVLAEHKEGLICLSGCLSSEFSELLIKGQAAEASKLAQWFHEQFGNDFYIEIQNSGLDLQKQQAEMACDIATKLGLPTVVTADAHYLCREDAAAHDVLLCINTGKTRSDENRMRYGTDQFYVRSPEEMYELFPGQEEAVKRSQEIADGCDIQLDLKARHFPVFVPPERKKPEDYLRELAESGLLDRYGPNPPQAARERLKLELDVICRMGFAGYFLIVWDFVRFAREKGIPASARGSACGALVSYVLHLSHVDPLAYDLLFERFLDPSRGEAPDIDIDFCQDRREEVIAYVRQKYGEQSVAQIATFGTMAARAAIKDVGRALSIPLARVTQLTEMVPRTLNITLDDALKQNVDLRKEYENDPQVHELIDIARKLEGTNRNAGTHAAGVVIADGPLSDHVPLQRIVRKSDDDSGRRDEPAITTQWGMNDLEKVGLLKMDFLGLRTLTLLKNAVTMIEKTRGIKLDLARLPLTDQKTYAMLQKGDAKGVFQMESDGIRELLKRMKPDNIRDLIACNALYRPGPLGGGMVDSYVNRKHGKEKPTYAHPELEEILAETYGVMVYQEQVMRILNRLGGIELSSAYACIKAISKKKQDVIDQRRAEFIAGSRKRGVSEFTAREIFDLITHFGGYGFNKSHSAAYGLLGFQTAYLKAHFTPEFMAALLSSEIDDGNKRDIMVQHIEDAKKLGVSVLPPSVNDSDVEFTVAGGKIVFGLCAIKGVGRQAAQEIVRARSVGGAYRDLFDLCERVEQRLVPKAALERLIKAGALDCFRARRAQLMHVLAGALQAASAAQVDRRAGQRNFLDLFESADEPEEAKASSLPDIPEWDDREKLKFEKEALDFYFSSHPLADQEALLSRYATHRLDQLRELQANVEVYIGGMITQIRLMTTKKARNGNSRYARCKIEDLTGSAECVMWPDDYLDYKDALVEDHVCLVKATVDKTREEPGLVLTRIMDLQQAQKELTKALRLSLRSSEHQVEMLERVGEVLRRSSGPLPVYVLVQDGQGRRCRLRLGESYWVNAATLSIGELEELLGAGSVGYLGNGNGQRQSPS